MSRNALAILIAGSGLLVATAARAQSSDKLPGPVNPWFVLSPLVVTAGAAADWKLTIYGFAEADVIRDSTRSFNDGLNNNVVAHPNTQANHQPRLQFTIRNSRLGFRSEAP